MKDLGVVISGNGTTLTEIKDQTSLPLTAQKQATYVTKNIEQLLNLSICLSDRVDRVS